MKEKYFKYFLMIIVFIGTILLNISIYNLDVLTNKLLIIFIVASLVVNSIMDLFLLSKKHILNLIGTFIYILLIFALVIGIKYVNKTNNFLNESFNNCINETNTYYVMVKTTSKYNNINDIKGKKIYYYSLYTEMDEVNNELTNIVGDYSLKSQNDIYEGFIKFMLEKDDIILLTDGVIDVLNEYYDNINNRIKSLYSFTVNCKEEENNISHDSINKNNSFNIYLSGSDSRAYKVGNKTRSDVNMVASVNLNTHTILLTSIPRDYYVYVHGQTGMKDKLTHSGIYGLKKSKQTVEDLFDIDIDYSVKVGFNAVVGIVDAIDGIEVYSDKKLNTSEGIIKKGINKMDGKKALAFARERHAYSSGDNHRVKNQQDVLSAVLSKMMTSEKILTNYDNILSSLNKFYITDIPKSEISNLVKSQLSYKKEWNIISNQVTGKSSMQHCYAMPKNKLYVMIPNKKSVSNARNKMIEVLES